MEGVEDEGQMGREERRMWRDRRQVEEAEVEEVEVEAEHAALLEELGKSGESGKREKARMFSFIVNQLC